MRRFLKKTALAMIAIAASWPVALSEQHLELSGGHKTLRCTYLAGGATAGIDGGTIYLVRNGNNPVQALLWTGISLTLRGEYDKIRLLGKKLTISENVEIPTLGAFFCPQYGETYYEIYVGNHSELAHFGWWGNRPQVKSRLIADWHLGKYALSLGFEYRYQGLECNDITTRQAVCSGIIGIRF